MADFKLRPRRPFSGFTQSAADVFIEELQANVVSLSVPNNSDAKFAKVIKAEFGAKLPQPNTSTLAKDRSARVVWSTPGQYLMYGDTDIAERCFTALQGAAYMTDQSHATVAVRITGNGVWAVLERLSTVDTHKDIFAIDNVTRIAIDHVSITILRESENAFILSSPSSSAGSFLNVITTTLDYLS